MRATSYGAGSSRRLPPSGGRAREASFCRPILRSERDRRSREKLGGDPNSVALDARRLFRGETRHSRCRRDRGAPFDAPGPGSGRREDAVGAARRTANKGLLSTRSTRWRQSASSVKSKLRGAALVHQPSWTAVAPISECRSTKKYLGQVRDIPASFDGFRVVVERREPVIAHSG